MPRTLQAPSATTEVAMRFNLLWRTERNAHLLKQRTLINVETKHLLITGRVQGVGFRNYMEYKARQFHITGWVRNRRDGRVEAMIQGTPENVAAIIARAQHGPPKAAVTNVAVNTGSGTYAEFMTLPTE